jgi:uncharacterized protein YaaN involved in tellurite resistance
MAKNNTKKKNEGENKSLQVASSTYNYEVRLAALTPEETERLNQLSAELKPGDIGSIQSYGSSLSRIVAQNGETLLNSVKADNTSEVVELTNQLLDELNLIDINELNNGGLRKFIRSIPILGRFAKSIEQVKIKYNTISANVKKISDQIDSAKVIALRDNGTLDQIFENNRAYINQMHDLILAAKLKEKEINDSIEQMKEDSNVEAIDIQDAQNYQASLAKKITELETVCFIMEQNLFQIRATQKNNIDIANRAENITTNVIPLWKNQLAISITMDNQRKSIASQNRVAETTNKILIANAKNLKQNSIQVAQANESNIISLETLRQTTESLIETAQEVKAIHDRALAESKEIEQAIAQYSSQIEQTMIETSY